MAVVRKGIQPQVDAVIQLHVHLSWLLRDKLDAIGTDPSPAQEIQRSLTMASLLAEHNQPRVLHLAHDPRPECQNPLVDFAEVVQAAECDEAILQCRQGIDRDDPALQRIVAPEAVGQANGLLGID